MFLYYFEAGMEPLDILRSSTYISAVHLNKENEIGHIQSNAFADIIAVKGDILNDFIPAINNLVFVMKEGEIYLDKTN